MKPTTHLHLVHRLEISSAKHPLPCSHQHGNEFSVSVCIAGCSSSCDQRCPSSCTSASARASTRAQTKCCPSLQLPICTHLQHICITLLYRLCFTLFIWLLKLRLVSLLLHHASCRFTNYHTTNKCTNCMSFIFKSLF